MITISGNNSIKIKKIFFLFSLIFLNFPIVAQQDSVHKHHLSVNLPAALLSGEAGLYYDYRLSEKSAFQLSYGHRFYSFNFIENGGGGADYRYFPQLGDIIRFGLKKYFGSENEDLWSSSYLIYRLSYWYLHTPKYMNRYGSNGLNSTQREVVSVDKNVLNGAIGIGREINFENNVFMDLFFSVGISAGQKKIHKYTSGDVRQYNTYPPNTFEKTVACFPTIELGCKVGFGW